MEWLAPISDTIVARALIASPTFYLLVNAAHIMAIGVLFGAILALDLRLLGLGRAVPLPPVAVYLSRLAGAGLLVAILTGLCLFSVRPLEYVRNPAFLAKLGLVSFGLVNVAVLHFAPGWRQVVAGGPPPMAVRLGATISILVWAGAIVAGRWIGFL
ncbi:MAG TPA: DUF6644 family protein [Pseudorhizobium sp.]|nr:DUF6644 family protein [Pseudorhizobium sp.]